MGSPVFFSDGNVPDRTSRFIFSKPSMIPVSGLRGRFSVNAISGLLP